MCRWLLKLIRTEVKDMSDYSTIQQYQPLRVPASFDTQGKQFIVQLNEILDDIYRRFGRLGMSDMSKKFRMTIDGKYDIVSGIDITDEGVDISGGKYIKLASGDYIEIGDWLIDKDGLIGKVTYLSNQYEFAFGKSVSANTYGISLKSHNGAGLQLTSVYPYRSHPGATPTTLTKEFGFGADQKSQYKTWQGMTGNESGISLYGVDYIGNGNTIVDEMFTGDIYVENLYPYTTNKYNNWLNHVSQPYPQYTLGSLGNSGAIWDKAYINKINYNDLVQMSSREVKHNIKAMEDEGERLDRLTPVTFAYNNDKDERKRYGLIWEDTVDIMPEICHERDGEKSINYVELVPMLLKENQTLRKRVASLEERISRLEGMLNV